MKIIIVDDEYDILVSLRKALNRVGFENVTLCNDSSKAVTMIKKNSYDILITDIDMPVINGAKLIEKVCAKNNMIKIIIMTVIENLKFDDRKFKSRILAYLDKPINLIVLIEHLNKINNKLLKAS